MSAAYDQDAFVANLSGVLSGLGLDDLRPRKIAGLGGKIWQLIKDALGNIDLSSMTKDEFLDKVDALYDSMVAPAIIAINPIIGPILNGMLNAIILSIAGKFYDNHSQPKSASEVDTEPLPGVAG